MRKRAAHYFLICILETICARVSGRGIDLLSEEFPVIDKITKVCIITFRMFLHFHNIGYLCHIASDQSEKVNGP